MLHFYRYVYDIDDYINALFFYYFVRCNSFWAFWKAFSDQDVTYRVLIENDKATTVCQKKNSSKMYSAYKNKKLLFFTLHYNTFFNIVRPVCVRFSHIYSLTKFILTDLNVKKIYKLQFMKCMHYNPGVITR